MLVIKRIHVRYELRLAPGVDLAPVERAFEHHMPKCPVYRSLRRAIEMTTTLEVTEG